MTHPQKNRLTTPLRAHAAEAIALWKSNLSLAEQFVLFRMSENRDFITALYSDILALLSGGIRAEKTYDLFPLCATETVVDALWKGENACVAVLRKYQPMEAGEWLRARFMINETFRQMVLLLVPDLCGGCYHTLREEEMKLQKLQHDDAVTRY